MDAKEINIIKEGCKIADRILRKTINNIRKFKTEKEIFDFLKKEVKANKVKFAFKPVIASKANASEIHHKPSNSKIKNGFLVLDFGIKYKGYCTDCTRTIYIGKPTKKEKELYNLVLTAQLTAIKYAKPGITTNDLDALTRDALGDYQKYFIHGLGHGVGKRIHQSPSLKPNNTKKLKKGMVLTIEPGIYIKRKLGIRIEDTIVLKDKAIRLTKLTKELMTK